MKIIACVLLLFSLTLVPAKGFTTLPMPTQTVKMQGKTLKLTTPYSDKNILKVISATGSNFEVKKQGNVLLVQSVEVYIPPKVIVQPSNTVARGRSAVLSSGAPTIKQQTWQIKKVDGKVVERKLIKEQVQQGRDKVVALGQGTYRGEAQEILMVATAYSAEEPGIGTRTAMGTRVRYGVVAVDPKVIPLGTKLYIEGYGYAVAEDVGTL